VDHPPATLGDLVTSAAAEAPDDPALIFGDLRWTFGELAARVAALAETLAATTPPGARIAVLAENVPQFVVLLLAAPASGRVVVPLNVRHTPAELVEQIARSGASLVAGTDEQLRRLTGPDLPPLRGESVLRIDDAGPAPGTPPAFEPAFEPAEPDAPAWLIFTSGTTGPPKGVVLTHRGLLAAVANTAAGRPLADDDVYLYPFPLYHVSAYNLLHALLRRRPVVLLPRFDAATVADLTARHHVTTMSLAPTMLRLLLDHLDGDVAPLATLRTVAYGAAAMPAALLREGTDTLGCGFAQGYGMTELSGNAVFLSPDDHLRGLAGDAGLLRAAGRAGPLVELRIVDASGAPAAPGEAGEIVVRGPQVCAGYWDDPDATAAGIVDGWLHTGDIGTLDADGLLTVVDRAKDLVVTGGENVSSLEVESAVGTHQQVASVAVVGLPDDRWGEAVTAVVVPRPGLDAGQLAALPDEVATHAAERLAGYKKPKRVVVVDELPVNAGGKVDKRALRDRLTP
jgi:acyl-CoA synthetase (AMP-forming)/AMP-acid ligase II